MLDLLWRTAFRWKLRPHHVTGDGKYGTLENIAALEEAGIRAYVALHESGSKPGFFPKGDFRYDSERDVYLCPAGKFLRPLGKRNGADRDGKVTFYRAKASECAVCQLRPRCTSNKNGRQLRRHPKERHADWVRDYRGTDAYEKALRKRKVWVEPLFAEAKAWHGMGRFRLRTLRRVNAEALMVAAGQNLKRLLTFSGAADRRNRLRLRPCDCRRLSTANFLTSYEGITRALPASCEAPSATLWLVFETTNTVHQLKRFYRWFVGVGYVG
jgi:hypothetical protein